VSIERVSLPSFARAVGAPPLQMSAHPSVPPE
jgi:hypothetical protein